jgi:hypothetical protein
MSESVQASTFLFPFRPNRARDESCIGGEYSIDPKDQEQFRPSSYIRRAPITFLEFIKQRYPDQYVLGIHYSEGDSQISITGTIKNFEQKKGVNNGAFAAINRELSEEVGIYLKSNVHFDKVPCKVEKNAYNQTWTTAIFSANMFHSIPYQRIDRTVDRRDIRSAKVQAVIVGTFAEFAHLLSSVRFRQLERKEHNIAGVRLIKISDIDV